MRITPSRSAAAFLGAFLAAAALAGAQADHLDVPYVDANVTIDGTFSPGEWTGALATFVEGTTPTTNPGWNPLDGQAVTAADLSYTFYVMHDHEYFYVAFEVTDDSVSDDYTSTRPDHTEVWNDDCTEVFIDGDRDEDTTESASGSPAGDRDWREGQQPHFGVRGQSHWENNEGYKDRTWWAATARTAGGWRTEYRFAFRGIDTSDGEATFQPLKTGDTIGFSVLVNDDDSGGDREDQLAWIGGGTNDVLYRSQNLWGSATMVAPPGFQTPGIPTRAENESLLIDTVPGAPGTLTNRRVFPQLTFESPMVLLESPDTSGRLFVVEQRGRIRSFAKADDPAPGAVSTFLDIASRVRSPFEGGGELEEGLLGLAFDPDYATNGELYAYYSVRSDPRRLRVSRFTANPPNAATVDPNTEEVLLDIPDPAPTHNGGMIAFGPDNMLYIGVGDGGGVGDNTGEGNNAQNTANLLGDMIRIDVRSAPDAGLAYRIPPDNPFVAGGPAGANTRKEIWAYGFRNPWRWSFDRQTGALLMGDVGQNAIEEVNVVKRGGNYGWRIMEGTACYNAGTCNQTGLTLPIATYTHDFGLSITGGFTYYGSRLPELYGRFLYGDYVSGRVWSLTYDPGTDTATAPVEVADLSSFQLGAFGQDQSGEVYLINLGNGTIHVLDYLSGPGPGNAVTTSPAPPVRGQSVTVTYNATGRILEGAANVNHYMGINGWTGVTTNAMTSAGSNTWTRTFTVPANATVLDMVFNNGTGTWDNNDGEDWHIATVAGGGGGTVVTTTPATPIRNQTVTIEYDATGRNLEGAGAVNIYRGQNGWANITTNPMTSLGGNRWSYSFTVPSTATVLDFVFNNGTGTWDNNGGNDWHVATAAARRSDLAEAILGACNGTRPFPTRLSDIPALLAAGKGEDQVNLGIIPYEPSAKLWSDGALKERFLALPGLDTIGYTNAGGWDFGEDAVIIKNFVLPLDERAPEASGKRIETRLLVKNCDEWYGFSYEWNEDETDATLLTTSKLRPFVITGQDGTPFDYEWLYPSRDQCSICHTAAANHTLGLTTAQLNFDFHYPASNVTRNQLEALDFVSIFGEPGLPAAPSALPKMPDPADTTAPIRDRARAYLAANCSMCHQPGGGGGGGLDLRWETADDAMGAIDALPGNDLGIAGARVVAPGDPMRSVLYRRVHTEDAEIKMPPLASSRIDEAGSQVIADWITSLAAAEDLGETWFVY